LTFFALNFFTVTFFSSTTTGAEADGIVATLSVELTSWGAAAASSPRRRIFPASRDTSEDERDHLARRAHGCAPGRSGRRLDGRVARERPRTQCHPKVPTSHAEGEEVANEPRQVRVGQDPADKQRQFGGSLSQGNKLHAKQPGRNGIAAHYRP
jgi:hypothetical protein